MAWSRWRPDPHPPEYFFRDYPQRESGGSSRADFLTRELLRELRRERHKKDEEKKKKDDKKGGSEDKLKDILAITGLLLLAGPFVSMLYNKLLMFLH